MVSARTCMTGKNFFLNIDKEINKLESFYRRNNIRLFFNVYDVSNEENAACVRKVVYNS